MNKSVLLVMFFLIGFIPIAFAAKIFVAADSGKKTLSEAIQMAGPHDTIEVSTGIYIEDEIIINKPVYLLGVDCPVINGNAKANGFLVNSDYVIIDGFEIINSGRSSIKDYAGISIGNTTNVTIKNCLIKDNYFGVYLLNSNNCTISNNRIIGNAVNETTSGNGIHLWKCKQVQITGNETSNNRDGIYFEFAENCRILNNSSTSNLRYGLHFMFSHGNQYKSNRFSRNGSGVAVMYTHNVEMIDNIFEDNWGVASYGLLLKDISYSKIYGNKFLKNSVGVYMEGVSNVALSNNNFEANGWGLKFLGNCANDTIVQNSFINNTFDMVTNSFSNENSNLIEKNYWDRYDGYDLNKDKIGDVPFRPVSLFSVYVEKIPNSIVLLRTFLINLLDSIERALPAIIPETLVDNQPLMKRPI